PLPRWTRRTRSWKSARSLVADPPDGGRPLPDRQRTVSSATGSTRLYRPNVIEASRKGELNGGLSAADCARLYHLALRRRGGNGRTGPGGSQIVRLCEHPAGHDFRLCLGGGGGTRRGGGHDSQDPWRPVRPPHGGRPR